MASSGSLLIRIGAEFVTTNKSRWQHDIFNVETSNWFSVHLEYYGRTTVNFTDAIHTSFNCTLISRTAMGGGRGGQGSESHNSVSINTHKTNSRRGYSYNVRSHNFLQLPDWNSPRQDLYIKFVPHSSCSMMNPRSVDSDGPQEWKVAWNVNGIGARRRWQQTRGPSPFSHIRP